MFDLIKKMLANDKIRYLFAGGCTTLVNLVAFFLLRSFTDINRNTCNAIAIAMAIAFAYFINKIFVFKSKKLGLVGTITEMVTFVGMRLVSMLVEILGFALLCDSFRLDELVSKLLVQIVVLVLNYVFSKLVVFKKEKKGIKQHLIDNSVCYISFGVVAVVMLGVCIASGIMPFGTRALTLVDSLHQYVPFFAEYREKLINEGSLFYSWNIALGSNFLSLTSYYLSSPFNFLVILFSKENIPWAMCLIMCLKVCLSAYTMAYFLSNKGEKKDKSFYIIPIAVAYALNNYVIGYYWNIMWIDCILIFPIIILGFQKLMEDRDPRMYTLSMFYALYCNYYIGFMICVFMVVWFFVYSHKTIKKFFLDGINFAIYSLASGGMAAFLLIPAYKGIMSTASASAKLPKWVWYGNPFDQLKKQFFWTDAITNQTFDGGINLYCGVFAIFAVFLYLLADDIKLWEKIKRILLLVFLGMSFNNELLNFIWHGFHNQYGIPNRFSFVFIFVLLLMAYDVLKVFKKQHVLMVVSAGMFAGSYVLLIKLKSSGVEPINLWTTLGLIGVYTVICALGASKKLKKDMFAYVLSSVCILELVACGVFNLAANGYADISKYYSSTPEVTAANQEVERLAQEDEAGFYRAELMDSTVLNEVTWHHMPSVGTFCSTVLGENVTTMGRLGFYTGANEFLYMGSTPFTNSLFNVRYLLHREGDLNNFDFDFVKEVEGVGIYENPYPLSLGFAVSNNVKQYDRDTGLPLANQANLASYMTGTENFFTNQFPSLLVSSDTMNVSVSGNTITYEPYNNGSASFMVNFAIDTPGDYYVNCRGNSISKIRFYIDGEELSCDRYMWQIFHLGQLEAGQQIHIEYIYNSLSSAGSASLYMATYDEEKYSYTHEILSKNQLKVEEFEDGYVYGTIDMPERETMFTSIPYDKGWKILVDGEEVEYYAIGKAFIGVDMTPGTHTVEMIYIPVGLKLGIIISVGAWLILMLGVILYSRRRQLEEAEDSSEDNSVAEEDFGNSEDSLPEDALADAEDFGDSEDAGEADDESSEEAEDGSEDSEIE
ncbi:MAG: YfhO family protein [Lachnospiraceae bacterium]|nr:YfhO family protein [Lachnospiraceae bacterium]